MRIALILYIWALVIHNDYMPTKKPELRKTCLLLVRYDFTTKQLQNDYKMTIYESTKEILLEILSTMGYQSKWHF